MGVPKGSAERVPVRELSRKANEAPLLRGSEATIRESEGCGVERGETAMFAVEN